jgi:hypothetical protein
MPNPVPPGRVNPLLPVDGVQVNFCRMPACANFGEPPTPTASRYRFYNKGKGKLRGLECKACDKVSPIKSNLGVAEELARASAYLAPPSPQPLLSCPNRNCPNHDVPVDLAPTRYQRSGKTAAGSQRFRCLACLRRFTAPAGSTSIRHRRKDANPRPQPWQAGNRRARLVHAIAREFRRLGCAISNPESKLAKCELPDNAKHRRELKRTQEAVTGR